jgi:tRNA modification GTPase
MPFLEIVRLTPPGRGAVASFLLCGKDAEDVFVRYWHGKKPVGEHPTWGRLRLTGGGACEEAVVHRTPDDGLEIHVHGGEQVASAIETLFLQAGAICKTWQEHFAAGTSQRDLALQLLPCAPTERTAQILLDQYNGAYDREMVAMEQLPSEEERKERWDRLQERTLLGKHLVEPFRVVLAGASNAGKSSLLNAILGFQRSLVYSLPGTTRDVVSGQTALDGFPVTFFDTAGFRETSDELELRGIDRSLHSLADADLIVWIIDLTVEESQRPVCPPASNVLYCYNKTDLADNDYSGTTASKMVDSERQTATDCASIFVCALTGEGIERLLAEVIRRLVPYPPEQGEAVPIALPHEKEASGCRAKPRP